MGLLSKVVPNAIPNYQQQTLCACLMRRCLSPCLGGWVNQCVVEHLPATMIGVPRNTWRGQQRVIPISMRGLVGPQRLKASRCGFSWVVLWV
jgi:hypothetical protein